MAENHPPNSGISADVWQKASPFNQQNVLNPIKSNPVNTTPNPPANGNTITNSIMKNVPGISLDSNHNLVQQQGEDDNAVSDDKAEDQLGVVETYADYKPTKLKIGAPHPDPVVETATLSSIEPNDITHELSIPKRIIDKGYLSALQLESIVYAAQAHERILPDGTRGGFLIGDGAGVGKGRTVAGVIFENFQKGREKAIWISVSNDLKYDAERDLEDIRALDIDVYHLNKMKYDKIDSKANGRISKGVMFATYSALISDTKSKNVKANLNSRLKLLVEWCGPNFDGVIIFDECHKAKHLMASGKGKSTKTGEAVLELQEKLPKARVVYASATGASEPRNMAYMVRLGLWGEGTPFKNFAEFLLTVEKRGVSAMEIVAMDMKLRGMYIARQLSFKGVTFKVEEVPIDPAFVAAYNDSVAFWADARVKFEGAADLFGINRKTMRGQFWGAHQRFFKYLCIASKVRHTAELAKEAVEAGKCAVIGLQSTGEARTLSKIEQDDGELDDFVSTAKAVLENLIENQFPAPSRQWERENNVKYTKKSKNESKSNLDNDASNLLDDANSSTESNAAKRPRVTYSDVVGDEHMPEMKSNAHKGDTRSFFGDEAIDDDLDDIFDMSSRRRRSAPVNKLANKGGSEASKMQASVWEEVTKKLNDPENVGANSVQLLESCKRACLWRAELLDKLEELGERLPSNTLDQLIDELGGPDEVAEMTGRKGRVVKNKHGEVEYVSRSKGVDGGLECVNINEKNHFMDGEKLIAIISEAASNGISLQSDRRAKNQRRRVHITLELPWSADRAIQQFGRTHRSNQVNAPEYIFLISNLAGERRFASSVSKRLESLGALTHGDRRATETRNLSQFNVENKYGRDALKTVLKNVIFAAKPIGNESPEEIEKLETFEKIEVALNDVGIEKSISDVDIEKFLNRILGLPVDLQNYLFDYFMDTVDALIQKAKDMGKFDLGIMDLGNTENAEQIRSLRFIRESATGDAPIDVSTVVLERGITWDEVKEKSNKIIHHREGFYRSKHIGYTGKQSISLALLVDPANATVLDSKSWKKYNVEFQVHNPHTGTQSRFVKLEEIAQKSTKVTEQEAQKYWDGLYKISQSQCSHMFWHGTCKNKLVYGSCDVGMSRRRYTVISGSLFAYWTKIEQLIQGQIRVIRLKMTDGRKIVGVLVPETSVDVILKDLRDSSLKTEDHSTL